MTRLKSIEPEKIQTRIAAFLGRQPELSWLVPLMAGLRFSLNGDKLKIDFIHPYFSDFYFKNCQQELEKGLCKYLGNIHISYGCDAPAKNATPEADTLFESFICSSRNEPVIAAARDLCTSPEPCCSVLVLRGASGTGKSHLLMEMSRAFISAYGKSCVLHTQAALFNPCEIPANFWRRKRALLLDDLQELDNDCNRQKSIAACLDHVFANTGSLRVAMTFNGDLSVFAPKLARRLEQALLLELYAADLPARISYIERTASRMQLNLPKNMAVAIARQIQKISAITGILQKYKFYYKIDGQMPSLDALEKFPMPDAKHTGWQRILMLVAERLNRKPAEILSKSRRQEFVLARQTAMFLCRAKLGLSYPELGRIFGGMDHSTVMHGIKKIHQLRAIDKDLHNLLTRLENELD